MFSCASCSEVDGCVYEHEILVLRTVPPYMTCASIPDHFIAHGKITVQLTRRAAARTIHPGTNNRAISTPTTSCPLPPPTRLLTTHPPTPPNPPYPPHPPYPQCSGTFTSSLPLRRLCSPDRNPPVARARWPSSLATLMAPSGQPSSPRGSR